jgi:hypothetical protein
MRDGFLVDWSFAAQASLAKIVQEQRPEEAHRWPLLLAFDANAYSWHETHLALILRGKLSGIPALGDIEPMEEDAPAEAPAAQNIAHWHAYLRDKYGVGSIVGAFLDPDVSSQGGERQR